MLSESASWILPCGVGEYGPDACLYVMWDIVLVLDSLDADLRVFNFLSAFWDKEAGKPVLDVEIGDAIRLTQGGKVVHERLLG